MQPETASAHDDAVRVYCCEGWSAKRYNHYSLMMNAVIRVVCGHVAKFFTHNFC